MDYERYDFDQFVRDVGEFLGLVLFCCVGVGLFYYFFRHFGAASGESLRLAVFAGPIWALIGYWGDLLNIDISDFILKYIFREKKKRKKK